METREMNDNVLKHLAGDKEDLRLRVKPPDISRVRTWPNDAATLSKRSRPTSAREVRKLGLVEKMKKAMPYAWTDGLGLAAVQIGYPLRMAWYCIKQKDEVIERVLINPEIVDRAGKFTFNDEACLSIPRRRFSTDRYAVVNVKSGREKFMATGLEALVVQHEIDHMDGIWCKDRVHRAQGVGRNDPCPCGSGKKYKRCCIGK